MEKMKLSELINKLQNVDGLIENCIVAVEVVEDNRIVDYTGISEILLNFETAEVILRIVT